MTRQRREKRSWAISQVGSRIGRVANPGKGFIIRAYASQPFCRILQDVSQATSVAADSLPFLP